MAAPVGVARIFTAHWADLAHCLPIGDDSVAKNRRREMFETFDPQGQGILQQARFERAFFRLMPTVAGISDMKLIIHQAWSNTRDVVHPIAAIGIDRMDRNQFRCLCIYLWHFFKLWDYFVQLSDAGTESRKVTLKQFEEVLPLIQEWGVRDATLWATNPEACFDVIDRNSQGWVLFEDLAEFILRRSLLQLSAAGDEECRTEAFRLLRRTHPELAAKEFPKKDFAYGGCPPVPPPGQKRPPMPIQLEGPGGMPSPSRRFKTQYMCDYLAPKYLSTAEVGSRSKSTSSTAAQSRALSRAMTPKGARPPSDLTTGIALIRSSSMPDATMRTQGMGRDALRSKLENHLDMYTTGQMRKLLKVAGGMVVGPGDTGRR